MAKTLEDKLQELPPERRKAVERRAKEIIAEEMTLRDIRKALDLTQEDLSGKLKIKQEAVSRLERRSDLLLSTLAAYIRSMGGELNLVVRFPGRAPVKLTGLGKVSHSQGED